MVSTSTDTCIKKIKKNQSIQKKSPKDCKGMQNKYKTYTKINKYIYKKKSKKSQHSGKKPKGLQRYAKQIQVETSGNSRQLVMHLHKIADGVGG